MLNSVKIPFFPIEDNVYLGYSEYWRKNKATLEHEELAYTLRALRKVGRYITVNMKVVEWLGMSEKSGNKFYLNPGFVKGEYPVPPGKMDILVGITAHEAFHCKELSDWVWIKAEEKTRELPSKYKNYLLRLIEVGEDIYVNRIARESVWECYLKKAWGWCIQKETRDLSLPPTAECLFQIWGEIILEGKVGDNYHYEYFKPLDILLSYVDKIIACCEEKKSFLEKSDYRSKIYLELWEAIKEYIRDWEYETPYDPEGIDIQDERGQKKTTDDLTNEYEKDETPDENFGKQTEVTTGEYMPRELSRRIEVSLSDKDENDITPLIEVVTGEVVTELLETRFWNSTMPCKKKPDPLLVRRLKRIFEAQVSKTPRMNRGLYSGKLDGRRLYRAPLNGRVFKQKEITIKEAWNITILVDASLSMNGVEGKEWELTESTFVSLYEAIKSSRNKLDILCYFERAKYCEIFRLLHHDKLYSIIPNGRTPTGQGIIAAALTVPKDKRRLILHITDGEPNSGGISVESAVKYCKKEGIELITIGCGYNEQLKEKFQNQYKENLLLIDTIDQLPFGLETLLRKKLLARV